MHSQPHQALLSVIFAVLLASYGGQVRAVGSSADPAQSSQPFWGIAYGPYHADQSPGSERPLSLEQIRADMAHLAVLAPRIRTYSVDGAQSQIPTLAAQRGMTVWLGASIGKDEKQNQREVDRLIAAANQPGVEAVIVGNEVLYRGDLSIAHLIKYIRRVRKALPKRIPVAYADAGDRLLKVAPQLMGEIDIALANIHPYWGGVEVNVAIQSLSDMYQRLITAYPGKRVVIGETGWPSAGLPRGGAVPGVEQERTFIHSLMQMAAQGPDMGYFYFDAFDEPYKRGGETIVEPHWGVYDSGGRTKVRLTPEIPAREPLPGRLAALQRAKANEHLVLRNGRLFAGLEIGLDTNRQRRDWLIGKGDALEMAYPGGQEWGAVFIVKGKVVRNIKQRETADYSAYSGMTVELKSTTPGESVQVGVKTATDPDYGREPRFTIKGITNQWTVYNVPLSSLQNGSYSMRRLKSLYVVTEFVFVGPSPHRILVRNIQYNHQKPAPRNPANSVYVGRTLTKGFDLGVATSGGVEGWVHDRQGFMECQYPAGQDWGAVFITAGKPTEEVAQRKSKDFSKYRFLTVELKGKSGGERVSIGIKTRTEPNDGTEPKIPIARLGKEWRAFRIPLSRFNSELSTWRERLRGTYVACELVFEPDCPAETVCFRNIRYER